MGKGDIRTKRGKIWRGTTGVSRPRKKSKGIRPAAPVRKVKVLKDLPKIAAEQIVKKPVVEAVKPQVAEVVTPAVEVVKPVVAETVSAVVHKDSFGEAPVHTETKATKKKEKSPAKKVSKPVAKKAPVAKKTAAKKPTAKKKKK